MKTLLDPSGPTTIPPRWASRWGEDRLGLWAELTVNGVVSCFRWMKPGRFVMGSPAGEPDRWANEMQREVTIEPGFWLADAACTQELWQAVMGANPSFFIAANHPVEQVSWHEVHAFCQRLNQLVPAAFARLPHEAEWEYACRAGTRTIFCFGDSITADQVNYDARRPLVGSPEAGFRKGTLPVKGLQPNGWGLYQMHGNVEEWCRDPYDRLKENVLLVEEHDKETSRVLRGGSWFVGGRYVRSAIRFGAPPNYHANDIGFRLALGSNQKKVDDRITGQDQRPSSPYQDPSKEQP